MPVCEAGTESVSELDAEADPVRAPDQSVLKDSVAELLVVALIDGSKTMAAMTGCGTPTIAAVGTTVTLAQLLSRENAQLRVHTLQQRRNKTGATGSGRVHARHRYCTIVDSEVLAG